MKGDAAINAIPTISIVILADKGRILNIIKTTAINANIIPITYRIILSFLFIINIIKVNLKFVYIVKQITSSLVDIQ